MAGELVRERYHDAEGVARVEAAVLARWRELLQLLERHRTALQHLARLMLLLREADALKHTLDDMKVSTTTIILVVITAPTSSTTFYSLSLAI